MEKSGKKHSTGLSKEFQRFILAPIPGDSTIAERFAATILTERIYNALNGIREASDGDLMAMLNFLSFEAPLNEEATAIYIHVAISEIKKIGEEIPDEFKEYEHLPDYLKDKMKFMKARLFESLVKASKEAEKIKSRAG